MKFSVLMSVYIKDNQEYFSDAVRSISTEQTIKPSQVVIVEDGKLPVEFDLIIEKIKSANKEIEFTIFKKNKQEGLAAALNDGIKLCKYEWIARMDSDDVSVPKRFEKQVEFIKQHPYIDIVGGYIDEFVDKFNNPGSIRRVGLTHDEIVNMAKKRTPMNHPTVFYSSIAVKKVGGYAVNFGKLEDYRLWVDMISNGAKFANLDVVLVHMRVGNNFIERRSNKREINDWDMLQGYLLRAQLIGKIESLRNKLYIRIFIYMPGWLKKITYKIMLRR